MTNLPAIGLDNYILLFYTFIMKKIFLFFHLDWTNYIKRELCDEEKNKYL